jgi:hypothetical protein
MRTIVVRSILVVMALVLGSLGGAVVGFSMRPQPKTACEGGAICEPWFMLVPEAKRKPAAGGD